MKLWIARDTDGELFLHLAEPFRVQNYFKQIKWYNGEDEYIRLSDDDFPSVTYENSPQQVELKLIEK